MNKEQCRIYHAGNVLFAITVSVVEIVASVDVFERIVAVEDHLAIAGRVTLVAVQIVRTDRKCVSLMI